MSNSRRSGQLLKSDAFMPALSTSSYNEDIRLCTINRADHQDRYGFTLSISCKEQAHLLHISPGRDNGPSNAELSGIKNKDYLIEINGQNIETFTHDQVTECILMVQYPQSLQLLVADKSTYEYYKQKQKVIYHSLPNVKIMPVNKPVCSKPSISLLPSVNVVNADSEYLFSCPTAKARQTLDASVEESGYSACRPSYASITPIRSKNVDTAERSHFLANDSIETTRNRDAADFDVPSKPTLALTPHPDSSNTCSRVPNRIQILSKISDEGNDADESDLSSEETDIEQEEECMESNSENNSYRTISVCKGDLATQQIDVIVVSSMSLYLFDAICETGGDTVLNSYYAGSANALNTSIISVHAAGQISSKKPTSFCKSIEKFVSDAIDQAVEDEFQSIAFPAIGCGQLGYSITIVAQAMVGEAYRKLSKHNISVSFVIQSSRADIYDEFRNQINLMQSKASSNIMRAISENVGKGTMEVQEGDLTKQELDVIIGSSSSDFLRRAILSAAGSDVQTLYDAERQNHPNATLITTPPGALPCKQIFFVKWSPDKDEDKLQQSLNDMMSTVLQNAISHNFTSMAFPAIGCGWHGCSVPIVVRAMVSEMKTQLIKRNLSWTVKFVIEPSQKHVYDEFCKQLLTSYEDLMESQLNQIPPTWEKSTDEKIRFPLSTTCDEYKSVVSNFDQHMKENYTQILTIERIQNKLCYLQYLALRSNYEKRLSMDTEKRLYHGCPEDASHSIIQGYFNRSFNGVNGTVYGKGVYFSSNAAYSHGYTVPNANGERCMFVARVLVGKTTAGNGSMITAPPGFDSTTDGDHIFVTYHDAQAMAEYLITYK